MIAISLVAVWLVVGLVIGAVFGTAIRKVGGFHDADAVPDRPAAQVRYLRKGKRTVGAPLAHKLSKHHHAAA